ncbi:MAG TPA: hypothetical protein VJU79_09350 [Candidatus Dormibacteraeota bacterium]|nr:hypothetical protein [Candidatus Dormibacteraeota bacterium]
MGRRCPAHEQRHVPVMVATTVEPMLSGDHTEPETPSLLMVARAPEMSKPLNPVSDGFGGEISTSTGRVALVFVYEPAPVNELTWTVITADGDAVSYAMTAVY